MPAAENWRRPRGAFDHFGMRFSALAAALLFSACASRAQPYRFSSPMLGAADVAPAPLPGAEPLAKEKRARAITASRPKRGWQADAQHGPIRTVSARGLEAKMPEASADAATAVLDEASDVVWSRLPAPHRSSLPAQSSDVTAAIEIPRIREPSDLRMLIGQRDKRAPFEIVMAWLDELGITVDAADGPALVAWADAKGKLVSSLEPARPGDLLVFDGVISDEPSDMIAIAIARDGRGVTEFLYAGGGVIRRGFLDPTRGSTRRDLDGAIVNTFLRHSKRWPQKGTRYLAGELLTRVIRTR